jgi:hypothetical protein
VLSCAGAVAIPLSSNKHQDPYRGWAIDARVFRVLLPMLMYLVKRRKSGEGIAGIM